MIKQPFVMAAKKIEHVWQPKLPFKKRSIKFTGKMVDVGNVFWHATPQSVTGSLMNHNGM